MEALHKVRQEAERNIEFLRNRREFVMNHIRNLAGQLDNHQLTRERRRQLKIEKEDYEAELDINTRKLRKETRDLQFIWNDIYDLRVREGRKWGDGSGDRKGGPGQGGGQGIGAV